MNLKISICVLVAVTISFSGIECQNSTNLPVVLWHGMGDSCCFPFSLGSIKKLIKEQFNNKIYVKSLRIGGSYIRDYESGYFISPNVQIKDACNQIKNDPNLKSGFNAIGFSQGSQFLRGLLQRCNGLPKMKNLVTLGGQHQGVFGLPNCPSLTRSGCERIRQLLNYAAYTDLVQKNLVQATYWHDPLNEKVYKQKSSFIADINNERVVNKAYVDRLQSLEKFVMVKFANDSMVQPVESEWFGFYKPGQDQEVQTLEESDFFEKDRLGLKQMKADGKLVFIENPGNHLQFTGDWFIENIVPYLK